MSGEQDDSNKHHAEDPPKGVKRSSEDSKMKVHTANDWEHARLEGGDERKAKFLRLMGAAKVDHKGAIKIGEDEHQKQHGRSEKEEAELESTLEKQFETNLEYKLKGGARRHKGFGFHEEESSTEKNVQDAATGESSASADKDVSASVREKEGEKQDVSPPVIPAKKEDTEVEKKTPDSTKKFVMSFVKASS